jgi:hypothetical protein
MFNVSTCALYKAPNTTKIKKLGVLKIESKKGAILIMGVATA